MSLFDHWHPVLASEKLCAEPVRIRLHGRDIVLFRAEDGKVGALDDCCPHRRMRLSMGTVVDRRLQCAYHGWKFDRFGAGESPGTPKLRASTPPYDTTEGHGAIWIKSNGSHAIFPSFDVDGHFHMCTLWHEIQAPLELVLDNFTEIEHTPTTHAMFGYALERMHEVQVHFEPTASTVRVINHGPPKRISLLLRLLLGIRAHYQFNDDWTTHFSPVYSVYDHWWSDPKTQREGLVRWRLYIFFTPRDEHETAVTTFAYIKSLYPGPNGCVRVFRRFFTRMLDHEIQLDRHILENLAQKDPSIDGLKLSRFDRVLGLNRERIERIYRAGISPEE
ncbi:MAG TPA: Rieske 2Fe-2S domain-containing protein [Gemmataceae bacterium]|nr:Rieske 2Fe-2S domain-containing protein [Gemmataceae bacterium]